MAVVCRPGKRGRYVLADNLASYYEGKPFRYEAGHSYYDYSDFVGFFESRFLNRRKAKKVLIYPHKVRSLYKDGWEETVMFSRQMAMGLRIGSLRPRKLGMFPVIYRYLADTKIRRQGKVITLEPVNKGRYIALAADVPIRMRRITYKGDKKLYRHIRFRGNTVKLLIESRDRVRSMNLVLAYGSSRDQAKRTALMLVRGKGWKGADRFMNALLSRSWIRTGHREYDRAVLWSLASAYSMVVEEFGKGIWAGLPWFRDNWGRDTFIALPGTLLVNGRFREARDVILNFARFQNKGNRVLLLKVSEARFKEAAGKVQTIHGISRISRKGGDLVIHPTADVLKKRVGTRLLLQRIKGAIPFARISRMVLKDKTYGRVPNRVSRKDIIYNTADGTLWFIREIWEYLQYSGDRAFARKIFIAVQTALEGALRYRTDKHGFLTHGAADTWMDARIAGKQAWSPRDNRAVEIQVLWNEALRIGCKLALINRQPGLARKWKRIAVRHRKAFLKLFWDEGRKRMADRVSANNKADYSCRPNQLMLLSVPLAAGFVPELIGAHLVRQAVTTLLYPYGIASLDQNHNWFHPYHEHDFYHKDAAYHNGTVWGWNAGFTVTALARYGQQELAWKLSRNLSRQILKMGCLGSMSENIHALPDKDGKIKLSGTFSQAWSVSEFARNAFQDYAGFRPRLMDNTVLLEPSLPGSFQRVRGEFAFGRWGQLYLQCSKKHGKTIWVIRVSGMRKGVTLCFRPLIGKERYEIKKTIRPRRRYQFVLSSGPTLLLNGRKIDLRLFRKSYASVFSGLRFARPRTPEGIKSIQKKQYLRKIILKQ